MPTIPRVSTPTVETQLTNQPLASDAPSGAFALGQLGQAASNVAGAFQKAQQNVDTARAEDALIQFERDKNDLFFNPETGYLNSAGKSAMDGATVTNQKLTDLQKQYVDSLDSEGARRAFQTASSVHVTRGGETIMRHAAKGQRTFELSNQVAAQENAVEGASLYWNDKDELNVQRAMGREAVLQQAKLEGTDATESLQTFESSFALTTIQAAVEAGDVTKARELLTAADNSKRLEGPDLRKAEAVIKKEDDKQYVMGEVDRIYRSGQSRTDMLEDARKETDPDKRKEIERVLTNQLNADKVAREEQQRETYYDRWKQISAGDMSYSQLSQDDVDMMSPTQLQNLQKAEADRLSGSKVPPNHILMNELRSMSRTNQAELQVVDYAGQLSTKQMTELDNLIKDARSGGGESVRSKGQALKDGVTSILGRAPKSKSKSDQAVTNAFSELVEDEIALIEANKPTGYKLSSQEVTDVINRLSRKFVEEDAILGFIDQDRNLKSIKTEHQPLIPDIARWLRDNGKAVTPENIWTTYQRGLDKGLFDD